MKTLKDARDYKDGLNQAGQEMFQLCRNQLLKAKEAFLNHDQDLAEEVLYIENRVNALDIRIDRDCERFIALYTPVAKDLRFVLALRKIDFELERIADHAKRISEYIIELDTPIEKQLLEKLRFEEMYDQALSMMENVFEAFVERDTKMARKVFKKDKVLDKINLKAFEVVSEEVRKSPEWIDQFLILFSVIKKTERIGDLITNIAEEIIFYRESEVEKHGQKKKA